MDKNSEFEQKAEAWGKKIEKEWSSGKKGKNAEYVANIIVNLILIAIWYRLPEWMSFVKDSFTAVLPLFYISFSLTIIANIFFLFCKRINIVSFVKAALNAVSIVVMISLYYIYPFDFSNYAGYWDTVVRVIIIVAIFGTAIGTIVELVQAIVRKEKK